MAGTNKRLTAAVETYLTELRLVRASGGATGERSSYVPLANLLNAIGATLKPKVFCVGELADHGAGHPDFGLYAAAEVLRRIADNLEGQGLGALAGARVKQAATERVFGFEIMPAPFVVAHLQVGLTMQELDAPLADDDTERAYTVEERVALGDSLPSLGDTTFDIYLNDNAFWRNIPDAVWRYRLGGYQVLKKWLSYRERSVLGRPLILEEVQYFADTVRRIGAILMLVSSHSLPSARHLEA